MAQHELVQPLTPREREVVALVGQGLSNHIIAHELGCSLHTIQTHIKAIGRKILPAGLTTPKTRILVWLAEHPAY